MRLKRLTIIEIKEAQRRHDLRQKQLLEERESNIERLQIDAKEKLLRVAILHDSTSSFETVKHKVQDHKASIREEDEWSKCFKGKNLPNTKIPAEVRSFQYKWYVSLTEHWDQQTNWWLECDDRSVLTQDIERADVRRVLMKKLREPTGKFYNQKLRSLMEVYNSLGDTLRRRKNISDERREDLMTILEELRVKALTFVDVLTFEVALHIDREMTSVDPHVSQYSFKAHDFVKFIWTFKDVPLPEFYKLKPIKMEPLNMIVVVSNRFSMGSSVLRGLWFKHDFLSDHCPSFHPIFPMQFTSLSEVLKEEFKVKDAMTEKFLTEMRQTRQNYEVKIEAKRLQEEENRKNRVKKPKREKTPDGKPKKRKTPKEDVEPPIVDETTFVDVDDEYVAYEDLKYMNEREMYTCPNLHLAEGDVNMREHQIINGIFKVECFKRPLQTKEINYNMFLRLDNHPHMLKAEDFHHKLVIPKTQTVKDERRSQFAVKVADAKDKALAELFKIEMKLSDKFLWGDGPIVCRWQPWEESEEFSNLNPEVQNFNLHHDEHEQREREKLFAAPAPCYYQQKIQLKDFSLTSPPRDVKLYVLLKHFIAPLMPEEFQHFYEQLETFKKKRNEWRRILEARADKRTSQSLSMRRSLFDELKMQFDLANVKFDQFNELFDQKAFEPRNLFPVEERSLIEVLEDAGLAKSVQSERDQMRKEQSEEDEIDVGIARPLKNKPKLLSELLREIQSLRGSLRPIYKKVQETSKASMTDESIKETKETEKATASAESLKLIPHHQGKWTTHDIYETSYDSAKQLITFYAGRLGTFAFATKKYWGLPFKSWELQPMTENDNKYVELTLVTQHSKVQFKITADGITFKIITIPRKPPFYELKSPVKIFELKRILTSLNCNLFPEVDARCFVENVSEKHKPMELHTYKSLATFCFSHHFRWSVWNRWAHRRVAIVESRMIGQQNFKSLMVTPLKTASVNVREKCKDLNVVDLAYEFDPLEQQFHADVHDFLNAEANKKEHRANLGHFMAMWLVQALLMNIQPISFSQ